MQVLYKKPYSIFCNFGNIFLKTAGFWNILIHVLKNKMYGFVSTDNITNLRRRVLLDITIIILFTACTFHLCVSWKYKLTCILFLRLQKIDIKYCEKKQHGVRPYFYTSRGALRFPLVNTKSRFCADSNWITVFSVALDLQLFPRAPRVFYYQ